MNYAGVICPECKGETDGTGTCPGDCLAEWPRRKEVFMKPSPRPVKPLTEAQLQVVIERNKMRKTATPEQLAVLAQVFPAPAQRNRTKATKQHTSAYNETVGRAGNTDWEKATYKSSDGNFTPKPKQQGKKK